MYRPIVIASAFDGANESHANLKKTMFRSPQAPVNRFFRAILDKKLVMAEIMIPTVPDDEKEDSDESNSDAEAVKPVYLGCCIIRSKGIPIHSLPTNIPLYNVKCEDYEDSQDDYVDVTGDSSVVLLFEKSQNELIGVATMGVDGTILSWARLMGDTKRKRIDYTRATVSWLRIHRPGKHFVGIQVQPAHIHASFASSRERKCTRSKRKQWKRFS
jgi:hypothetical protein